MRNKILKLINYLWEGFGLMGFSSDSIALWFNAVKFFSKLFRIALDCYGGCGDSQPGNK